MFDETKAEGKDVLMDLAPAAGAHVGRIVGYERPGWVFVQFVGYETREAKLVAGLNRERLNKAADSGQEALIVFEGGDPDRPIVVGLMESAEVDLAKTEPDTKQPLMEAVVDGETVKIEGPKKIVLRCGKGSITITKDGKIMVRGTDLLSRSSGPNRIKGGSVQIN